MRALVIVAAALALAACSKSGDPRIASAGSDLKSAAAKTGDAAKDLATAGATAVARAGAQAKVVAAGAAAQTGSALKDAGAKAKRSAGGE